MTVASVRRSLKLEGRSASIRDLVKQRDQIPFQPNVKFPLSLRKFIGALPPGRGGRPLDRPHHLRRLTPGVLLRRLTSGVLTRGQIRAGFAIHQSAARFWPL